jgi:cell division protein FtsB
LPGRPSARGQPVRGVIVALRRPRLGFGIGPQVVAVLLVVGLAGAMAIQPTRQLLEQRARIAEMTRDLRRIERDNARLAVAAERLRDPDYLERQARAQIGLVRPGETTFFVMPPSRKAGAEGRQAPKGPAPRRSRAGYFERLLAFIGGR